jgi:hypothetical protein
MLYAPAALLRCKSKVLLSLLNNSLSFACKKTHLEKDKGWVIGFICS